MIYLRKKTAKNKQTKNAERLLNQLCKLQKFLKIFRIFKKNDHLREEW